MLNITNQRLVVFVVVPVQRQDAICWLAVTKHSKMFIWSIDEGHISILHEWPPALSIKLSHTKQLAFAVLLCFMSGGKIAAPAAQGPGIDKQDPSVKTTTVPLCVSRASFSTTCLPNYSCLGSGLDEPRVLQYVGVATITIKCPSSYSSSGWTINTFVPASLFISYARLFPFPMGVTCLSCHSKAFWLVRRSSWPQFFQCP